MFMRRKKGFSLVEMLVVIAIIAVLVSIIIPTVGASQTKANAAANAANLRSVKGQLAVLMVDGQFTHDDAISPTNLLQSIDERIEYARQEGNNFVAALLEGAKIVIEGVSNVVGALGGGQIINRMNNTYYAQNGVLTINGTEYAAPTAKPVSVEGLNLRKDTEMTVTFAENNIVVTYDGITPEIFAIVAEEGDAASVDMATVPHTRVDGNNDGVCDYCNNTYPHGPEDYIFGEVDSALGNGHVCSDSTKDCICDEPSCKLPIPCVDENPIDHNCDNCNKKLSEHTFGETWYNKCTYCGYIKDHVHECGKYISNCDTCGEVTCECCKTGHAGQTSISIPFVGTVCFDCRHFMFNNS